MVEADPHARDGYVCLYRVARGQSRYDQALTIAQVLADAHPDVLWAWSVLASLRYDQSRPDANEAYARAIALIDDDTPLDAQVLVRIEYATSLRQAGKLDDARAQLQAAATHAADDPLLGPVSQLELARHEVFSGGDHEAVLRALEALRPRLFPDAPYQPRLNWLHTREVVLRRLGRIEEALAVLDEMQALAHERGDRYVEATTAFNGAIAYSGVLDTQATADVEGYRRRIDTARALAESGTNPSVKLACICMLAELTGPEQLGAARRCLDAVREFDEPDTAAPLAATAAVALHDAGADEAEVLAAIAFAEAIPANADGALERALLLLQIDAARDLDRAASNAEGAAIDLRAILARTDSFITAAELGQRWRGAFAYVAAKLSEPEAPPASWARGLRLHDTTLGAAWDSVMTPTAPLELDMDPARWLARLQAALRPDDALVVYSLDEASSPFVSAARGGSRAWVVTSDAIAVHPLPSRHRVAAAIRAWRQALTAGPDATGEPELAASVGAMLLSEVAALDPAITHLTVVADAEIHEAPIAALVLPGSGERAATRWTIERAPSVRALRQWREHPIAADDRPLHVLAAPTATAVPLPPLPRAEDEAAGIASLYGPATIVHLGPEASEAVVEQTAGQRALLHVAAHASVSGGAPLRSALHLAGDATHDGELTVAEIFGQRFDGEVVVLSSCETHAGVVLGGEGLGGLAQAFFNRGARAVVATLWPVRDDAAATFTADLYRALAQGAPLRQALTQAQRTALTNGRPPETWAPFILLGDGRLTLPSPALPPSSPTNNPNQPTPASEPPTSPTPSPWWITAAALLLLLLLLLLAATTFTKLHHRPP